jgi:tetratricopeptide (TPR) repeat protein
MQLATSNILPCDAHHHYYHYQSSAQYMWLGKTLQLLGKNDEAIKAYKNAIFQDHLNYEATERIASCRLEVTPNNFEMVSRSLQLVEYTKHPATDLKFCISINKTPDEATRNHDKALMLYLSGGYRSALAALLDLEHSNSRFLMAKCWFALKNYENAHEHLREAIRISHIHHDTYHRTASDEHLVRGRQFMESGEIDLAIADFSKALDLHQGNKEARKARAAAYFTKGNMRMAEEDEAAIA